MRAERGCTFFRDTGGPMGPGNDWPAPGGAGVLGAMRSAVDCVGRPSLSLVSYRMRQAIAPAGASEAGLASTNRPGSAAACGDTNIMMRQAKAIARMKTDHSFGESCILTGGGFFIQPGHIVGVEGTTGGLFPTRMSRPFLVETARTDRLAGIVPETWPILNRQNSASNSSVRIPDGSRWFEPSRSDLPALKIAIAD